MKVRNKLCLLGTTLLLVSSAFADTPPKNSIYISGMGGYGALSTPDRAPADPDGTFIVGSSYSNRSLAAGANLGFNHALSDHILVGSEVGWDYNGQAQYSTTYPGPVTDKLTINSYDYHLLVTSTYLLSNGLNFFGKIGAAQVFQKGIWSDTGWSDTQVIQTQWWPMPMVAAGVGYQIKMVNLFIQYDHIFGQNAKEMTDVFNSKGEFANTVATDSIKAGLAINIAI